MASAVDIAQQAFSGWKAQPLEDHIALVLFLELFECAYKVKLVIEIRDGSKVFELVEGDFTQIRECAEHFCSVAEWMTMGDGPSMLVNDHVRGFIRREFWGVVVGIIPSNYSIVLTAWFMFPSLFAGNYILMKPAGDTPLSVLYIGNLAAKAGFQQGVINVLLGRGEITEKCMADRPGVRCTLCIVSPGLGASFL